MSKQDGQAPLIHMQCGSMQCDAMRDPTPQDVLTTLTQGSERIVL